MKRNFRNNLQKLTILAGLLLIGVGLSGIFSPEPFLSFVTVLAGGALLYNGKKQNDRDALLSCMSFGVFFSLQSLSGIYLERSKENIHFTLIGIMLLSLGAFWWNSEHDKRRVNRHDRKRHRFNRTIIQH